MGQHATGHTAICRTATRHITLPRQLMHQCVARKDFSLAQLRSNEHLQGTVVAPPGIVVHLAPGGRLTCGGPWAGDALQRPE